MYFIGDLGYMTQYFMHGWEDPVFPQKIDYHLLFPEYFLMRSLILEINNPFSIQYTNFRASYTGIITSEIYILIRCEVAELFSVVILEVHISYTWNGFLVEKTRKDQMQIDFFQWKRHCICDVMRFVKTFRQIFFFKSFKSIKFVSSKQQPKFVIIISFLMIFIGEKIFIYILNLKNHK